MKALRSRIGILAEEHFLEVAERRGSDVRFESLAKATQVLADEHRVVIDNQNAVCHCFCGSHDTASLLMWFDHAGDVFRELQE